MKWNYRVKIQFLNWNLCLLSLYWYFTFKAQWVLYVYSCLTFTNPRSAHSVFMLCASQNRQRSFPYTDWILRRRRMCSLRGTRFVRFAVMLRIHRWRNVQCRCHYSQFDTLLVSPNSGASPNFTRGTASVAILNCLNLGAGFGSWTRIVSCALQVLVCSVTSFSRTVAPTSQNDISDSWMYCCSLSLSVRWRSQSWGESPGLSKRKARLVGYLPLQFLRLYVKWHYLAWPPSRARLVAPTDCLSLSCSGNSSPAVSSDCSVPCSQQPAARPCPDSRESTPYSLRYIPCCLPIAEWRYPTKTGLTNL